MKMKICAWCPEFDRTNPEHTHNVSHTICARCKRKIDQKLAMQVRDAVMDYLGAKYTGDLTWHPLFVATRDLFVDLMR